VKFSGKIAFRRSSGIRQRSVNRRLYLASYCWSRRGTHPWDGLRTGMADTSHGIADHEWRCWPLYKNAMPELAHIGRIGRPSAVSATRAVGPVNPSGMVQATALPTARLALLSTSIRRRAAERSNMAGQPGWSSCCASTPRRPWSTGSSISASDQPPPAPSRSQPSSAQETGLHPPRQPTRYSVARNRQGTLSG
jgi:hypothetical protein